MKILFVCSRNRLRSLTAERLFDGVNGHEVRSAGTEQGARIRVTAGHLGWADLVVAMEKRHVSRLRDKFADALSGKRLVCLHVPDEYAFMDPALVERLDAEMAPYLVPDEQGFPLIIDMQGDFLGGRAVDRLIEGDATPVVDLVPPRKPQHKKRRR